MPHVKLRLSSPTDADIRRLAEQCSLIQSLVDDHYPGEVLEHSMQDLDILQRILDDEIFETDHTYALQSLGIAFGRICCKMIPDLDWAVIEDEYGRDPTLCYRKSSLQINVLTMISKRVERGETPNVRDLFDWVRAKVAELQNEVDSSQ